LRSEKIKVLTVVAQTWSERKIARVFDTSRHMAKIAKKTAREKGIFSDPNSKRGKTLEEDTVQRVKEFF